MIEDNYEGVKSPLSRKVNEDVIEELQDDLDNLINKYNKKISIFELLSLMSLMSLSVMRFNFKSNDEFYNYILEMISLINIRQEKKDGES